MKHTIIIPCSRPERLPFLLPTLPDSGEILVVTPENNHTFPQKHVRIIRTNHLYPPGHMRNIGAAQASGDILFFIDDDCIPNENWFNTMLAVFTNETIGVTGCRVVSRDKDYWSRCADFVLFTDYQHHRQLDTPLGSAAIAARKTAFREIGGFDQTLYASEDWDFCLRLISHGWVCRFEPSVEVLHDHQRNNFIRIHRAAYLSGYRSGLIAQQKNINHLSWLASLSVSMSSPFLYFFLIIPYALAVGTLQFFSLVKDDSTVWRYLPWIYTGRATYHYGVWRRLMKKEG